MKTITLWRNRAEKALVLQATGCRNDAARLELYRTLLKGRRGMSPATRKALRTCGSNRCCWAPLLRRAAEEGCRQAMKLWSDECFFHGNGNSDKISCGAWDDAAITDCLFRTLESEALFWSAEEEEERYTYWHRLALRAKRKLRERRKRRRSKQKRHNNTPEE